MSVWKNTEPYHLIMCATSNYLGCGYIINTSASSGSSFIVFPAKNQNMCQGCKPTVFILVNVFILINVLIPINAPGALHLKCPKMTYLGQKIRQK